MSDIREYWDKWIIEWEEISYEGKTAQGFVERFASRFRSVGKRMDDAFAALSPLIKGRSLLDLGCGSGIFDRRLVQAGAQSVWGIDFSRAAIDRAVVRASDMKVGDRCHYDCANVVEATFPKTDITIALGLLDYLKPDDVTTLLRKVESPYCLMSFLPKKFSVALSLHSLYTRYRHVPTVNRYAVGDIRAFLRDSGKEDYVIDEHRSFITSLPSS